MKKNYPSDMNDAEWEIVKEILERELNYTVGRKKEIESYREIINAMFYINKTGVQWAYLPHDYPAPTTINYHYMKWSENGLLEKINDELRGKAREKKGKKKATVGIIDSQSVKNMAESGKEEIGYDGGKKVRGRKRSIVVDTEGYVISAQVNSANKADGKIGKELLDKVYKKEKLKKIYGDKGYRGEFVKYAKEKYGCEIEIEKRKIKGFEVIEKRWIVERTLGWLTRNRRLAREYEKKKKSSEGMIYLGSSRLLMRHIASI